MKNAYCLFFLYSFQAKLWTIFLQALMDVHLTQTEGGTGVQWDRGKKIQKVTEHVVISDFWKQKQFEDCRLV